MYGYGYQYGRILGKGGGGGGGFDADYQAVLDYATAQGYTLPSGGQQTLQNDLVVALKDGGIWSKLDSFRVYATDGDSDFALIDWKRLIDCTAINSPTFTTNQGYGGNGTSSYIHTNFNPNTSVGSFNYKLNDASFGSWVYSVPTIGVYNQGLLGSANSRFATGNFLEQRVNGGNCNSTVDLRNTGFKSLNKVSSLNYTFINNTNLLNRTTNTDVDVNSNFVDLTAVGASQSYSNVVLSIGYAGASLVAESTDFYTALNTYITSL